MSAPRFVLLLGCLGLAGQVSSGREAISHALASAAPQSSGAAPSKSIVVYVSDFDLDVSVRSSRRSPPATSNAAPPAQATLSDDDPAKHASLILDTISANLVRALDRAGYTARRLPPGEARPQEGFRIRGVFSEVDDQARVRRALLGGGSKSPVMQVFVGINNLSRPDQAFYEITLPKGTDSKYGPGIVVSPYVPVSKFELSKDPTEDDIRKMVGQIVANFNSLLNANPDAVAQ